MRIGNILKEQEENQNAENNNSSYRILAVDDEIGIVDSLSIFLKRSGYTFAGETDPTKAIERIKNEHFDLLLLDFIMTPLHGDQVVEEIRKFNKDLYIILLTGHKDLAPPLETIRRLDIQGYCEKSDKFDQLLLLIESGIKSVAQMTKDTYTRGHSDRVSEYSVLIGKKLGLNEEDLRRLRIGGLFHDIGKIGVPDNILQKNGKLSDDEYSEIKNHPTIGVHILSNATMFEDILPIVKHHHERYDGRGYPGQLKGEEIPYLARIAAVADSFDAMTSRRVYRDSLPLDVVIEEIDKNKGTQFDPNIADAFLDILKNDYEKIKEIQEKFIS